MDAAAATCAVAGGVLGGESVVDCDVVGVGAAGADVAAPVGVAVCCGPDDGFGCVVGGASVVDGTGELDGVVGPVEPPPVVGEPPAGVVDDGSVGAIGVELESSAADVVAGVDVATSEPVGDDVVGAGASVGGFGVPSEVELEVDEDDGPAGSAWAMPAPVISAAPSPTVMAEFVTHLGTSCVLGARCRPWLILDALAARALALARFFTR